MLYTAGFFTYKHSPIRKDVTYERFEQALVVMEAWEENLRPPIVRSLNKEGGCEGQQPYGLQLEYQNSAG